MIPTVVEKDKAPSRRKTGADQVSVGLMDTSRRLVQDHGSREQSGPRRPLQASRECTDFHSEEKMMVDAHGVENLPGKQVTYLRGDKVTGSQGVNLRRKAGRGDNLNGMLAQGESRELRDRDSLEDNNGRLVPVGNRDTDYDGKIRFHYTKTKFSKYYAQGNQTLTLIFPQKPEKISALKYIH